MEDKFTAYLTELESFRLSRKMTKLDLLGMRQLAKEIMERRFNALYEKRLSGKVTALESLEELKQKDKEREKDGFLPKIKFRRVLAGPGKVIVVPYIEEEELVHAEFELKKLVQLAQSSDEDDEDEEDLGETTGHGEGEIGDIIGEEPLPLGGSDDGDGDGEGDEPRAGDKPGEHFEEEAYAAGKELIERLQLPNLREKRKKVQSDKYTYDLTDRHKGSGQFLDKKETLKRIIKTNLVLGRVDKENPDPTKMIASPEDMVYRVLFREKVWESQAVAIFLRDYSGSMWGEPTKALISQHLMIYAWLLVQYENKVIPRFFVHDTAGREVTARQYFGLISGGGTIIASGYKKINEVIEGEALARDYNIYVFQGTDGDDFDDGRLALPEIRKILEYANRMGVTLFKHPYYQEKDIKTSFEQYIEKGGILEKRDVFRMHIMPPYNVTEEQNIEALKALIAQD
jgi:uncharacterized sporulation protein YeaH/YhbH (DUF444 family)